MIIMLLSSMQKTHADFNAQDFKEYLQPEMAVPKMQGGISVCGH